MKIIRSTRLSITLASLACAAAGWAQTSKPVPSLPPTFEPPPIAAKAQTIPEIAIHEGSMSSAVQQLTHALNRAGLPEMNIILTQETRMVAVPELTLRNVSGPDALRLITVSAGCDVEDISGGDGQIIGYRVLPPAPGFRGAQGHAEAVLSLNPFSGHSDSATAAAGAPPGPMLGAPARLWPGPGGPGGLMGGGGGLAPTHGDMVMGFTGMPSPGAKEVRVYSLGGVTNLIKLPDVETTLRDILKGEEVSPETAKLAFHQGTNVLVVTADARVHGIVNQFLDALQKNVSVAAAEDKVSANARREAVELMVRLDAKEDQMKRLEKLLSETEERLHETQRELDRMRAVAPKAN